MTEFKRLGNIKLRFHLFFSRILKSNFCRIINFERRYKSRIRTEKLDFGRITNHTNTYNLKWYKNFRFWRKRNEVFINITVFLIFLNIATLSNTYWSIKLCITTFKRLNSNTNIFNLRIYIKNYFLVNLQSNFQLMLYYFSLLLLF